MVKIEFYDHCQNLIRPLHCTVYGRIYGVTPMAITVESWVVGCGKAIQDENNVRFTIIRSAIKMVTRLVPK